MKTQVETVTAFAPGSSANVAVGYDILGFAVDAVGDKVTLTKRADGQLVIKEIIGVEDLPYNVDKNTCTFVIKQFLQDRQLTQGFDVTIEKGIPLGSGLGGSAASSVAAIMALNGFLEKPLSQLQLIDYALYGEQVATGQKHPDNVVPSVMGGFTLTRSMHPLDIVQLPCPDLRCVLVKPSLRVDTKKARAVLDDKVMLFDMVQQSANLAAFICSLYENNLELMQRSLVDIIIEPKRASLVTGFHDVKKAALANGAIGCSLSGSGPTIFALCQKQHAENIAKSMVAAFLQHHVTSQYWISQLNSRGSYQQ